MRHVCTSLRTTYPLRAPERSYAPTFPESSVLLGRVRDGQLDRDVTSVVTPRLMLLLRLLRPAPVPSPSPPQQAKCDNGSRSPPPPKTVPRILPPPFPLINTPPHCAMESPGSSLDLDSPPCPPPPHANYTLGLGPLWSLPNPPPLYLGSSGLPLAVLGGQSPPGAPRPPPLHHGGPLANHATMTREPVLPPTVPVDSDFV